MKPAWHARPVVVAGIAISRWGYLPEVDSHTYGSEAIRGAIADAGLTWGDMQAVFCGSVYQGTGSGHKVVKEVGRTGIPIVNVENACSSSASALRLALQQVATGIYDVVLVLGIEKNPRGPIPSTAFQPWELELGFNFHPANYAIDASKIARDLGWKPRFRFAEALPLTIRWYQEHATWLQRVRSGAYREYYARQYGG